jgi:hypothetical protein
VAAAVACGAGALGAIACAPAAQARIRPAIRPPHRRPFVPVLGDWEGTTAGGYRASFELVYRRAFGVYGTPYGWADLTLFSPSYSPAGGACSASSTATGFTDYAAGAATPLARGGGLGLARDGLLGGLTGARRASLTEEMRWPPEAQFAACPRSIRWRFHPAVRRPVDDGEWTLQLQDGETQKVEVLAGGRGLVGLGFPNVGECAGTTGGLDLFIAPDGVASYGEAPTGFHLTFTSPTTLSGEISLATLNCGVRSFAVSGSLAERRR